MVFCKEKRKRDVKKPYSSLLITRFQGFLRLSHAKYDKNELCFKRVTLFFCKVSLMLNRNTIYEHYISMTVTRNS